jgi:DMSO reductase family type II enzyme chaperone
MTASDSAGTRSATYAFLANALQFPDTDLFRLLSDKDCISDWKRGISEHFPDLGVLVSGLAGQLDEFVQTNGEGYGELTDTFVELFGHTVRGACPPYESEYGKAEIIQQASELADIQGFYEAFGLRIVEGAHERIDHACVECEFMSALAAREAHAFEEGSEEARLVMTGAQASFLADHMGRWVVAFGRRLQDADEAGFYGHVGALAARFVQIECERFDVPCGPEFLELKESDPVNDRCMQCGVESSCPGARQTA